MITESSKKGEVVVIEISPRFYSTWDYGKMHYDLAVIGYQPCTNIGYYV